MAKMIKLICPICNKEFNKNIYERNRQLKKNPNADFYCCKECASIGIHNKERKPIIKKICPICNKEFEASTKKRGAIYCSRSCASKGSITEARRNAGRQSAILNFTEDTHNVQSIQKLLKKRENWKYKDIEIFLKDKNINFEFEFVLENYIYDLVLFDNSIIIEFDGPDHNYIDETDKESVAEKYGFKVFRIGIIPNTIIKVSSIINLI